MRVPRMSAAIGLSVLLLGAFVAAAPTAMAATITVTTTSDEFGAGAGCSLREAIQAANTAAAFGGCPAGSVDTNTILLPAGTHVLSIDGVGEDLNATGDLDVRNRNLVIEGAGMTATRIDGGGYGALDDRILHVVHAVDLVIRDVMITGGWIMSASGGGLRVESGAKATLDHTDVHDNYGSSGAGGIHVSPGADLSLQHSRVTESSITGAGDGIGIKFEGGALSIANSEISDNGMPGVDNSGGGLWFGGTTGTVTNTTFSGNRINRNGGGILALGTGTLDLLNVTITNNLGGTPPGGFPEPGPHGGGIYVYNDVTVRMKNSIVAGNDDVGDPPFAPDCYVNPTGTFTSLGNNIIGDTTGCTVTPAAGDIFGPPGSPVDPKLGPLAANGGPTKTHALLPGSPAIDAADPAAAPATDQRGAPRNPDIGAYELVSCKGVLVNVVGTDGGDVLVGTGGRDGMLGLGGNDVLRGRGGKDSLCGGPGNDKLIGGPGKDKLIGGPGKDVLRGGPGNDLLNGGPGKDTCRGGGGKNKLRGCER